MFTFDYLKQEIPRIAEICDAVFDRMEEANKDTGAVNGKLQCDLFKMGLNIFSSVVISGFMGQHILTDKIDGQTVN